MLVDLHVHTLLSADSNVSAEQYLETNHRHGGPLGAICFTEHRFYPTDHDLDRRYAELSDQFGVKIFKGVEADTDFGHLLLYGLNHHFLKRFKVENRMLKSSEVIEVLHGEGGLAIPAHPFRDSAFGQRLEELVAKFGNAMPAIEALNGQNSPEQNQSANAAAVRLGLTEVGGSDAHFSTEKWFLTCATEFERHVTSIGELCTELRAGRVRARQMQVASG